MRFKQEYDMPNQLFHVRYDEDNYITSEIHDFNTGLKYTYSGQTGGCEIEKIESRGEIGSSITWNTDEFNQDGKYVSLRNPAQFFDINSDFQYIGMVSQLFFNSTQLCVPFHSTA